MDKDGLRMPMVPPPVTDHSCGQWAPASGRSAVGDSLR